MGKARQLKKLRRSLRENTPDEVRMQQKVIAKEIGCSGQHITRRILRHDPESLRGKYKRIKKEGGYGDE